MNSLSSSRIRFLLESIEPFRCGLLQLLSATDTSTLFYTLRLNLTEYETNTYLIPSRDLYTSEKLFQILENAGANVNLVGCDAHELMTRIHDPHVYWKDREDKRHKELHLGVMLSLPAPRKAVEIIRAVTEKIRYGESDNVINRQLLRLNTSNPCSVYLPVYHLLDELVFSASPSLNAVTNLITRENECNVVTYTTGIRSRSKEASKLEAVIPRRKLNARGEFLDPTMLFMGGRGSCVRCSEYEMYTGDCFPATKVYMQVIPPSSCTTSGNT